MDVSLRRWIWEKNLFLKIKNRLKKDWLNMKKKCCKKKGESSKKNNKNSGQDYKDLYVRVMADFKNYKRRVEKERSDWVYDAQAEVLNSLLFIVDDLERAIESCKKQKESEEQKATIDGLELIEKNVKKALKDLGVKPIDCSGKFDPDFHEALVQVDSKDHKSGDIVDVINKGYVFNSKVLKHAKVSVAK